MQHLPYSLTSMNCPLFSLWLMCWDFRSSLLLAFKMHWQMKLRELFGFPFHDDNWSNLLLHNVFYLILLIKFQRGNKAIQSWFLLSNSNFSSFILLDSSRIVTYKVDFTWLDNGRTFVKRKSWGTIVKIS